jgi:hypothetical protein
MKRKQSEIYDKQPHLFAYLIGEVVGHLTITGLGRNKHGRSIYICQCICGNTTHKLSWALTKKIKLHCDCKHNAGWKGLGPISGSTFYRLVKNATT